MIRLRPAAFNAHIEGVVMDQEERFKRAVARRVREAREAMDPRMSQEDIGKLLGLSKVGYGHYERGTHTFSIWQLTQLAESLVRSVEYFLGVKTELTPDEDELLTIYRSLTSQFKGVALRVLRTFPQKRY
jgi:transcriptional regulator with XRE-family HTH domain